MDDNTIVDLLWQRSEDALTAVAKQYGAYCRKIADNILRSGGDAEECVNETWLRAWNAIPPARPTRLKAFLSKITRNIALDRYEAAHSQKRGGGVTEVALDELAEIPAPQTEDEGEITKVINDFLRGEPSENADVFIKRYWYLLSVKEIAAEYGYSANKITSLLFRMRGRLKQNLESEGLL
ncbi:MAG: sigma-70 family RNA polymerase sigma factor [Oscillospiraceae bacterium]|jgi:RNA polymerase sigma-70 factor (ECF subfamily)|nr:sigma-70 family RNA polymerase sigma factor [Oscillospiraceae bacterium]